MTPRAPCAACAFAWLLTLAPAASAEREPRTIDAGTNELGLAASTVSVEGSTHASLALRFGTFLGAPRGAFGLEAETGWTHVRSHDALDVLGSIAWAFRAGKSALHPFAGVIGGVRQEWLGSFRESRYPLGAAVGARVVVAEHAAIRAEWRGVRVLDDPVRDPFEHRMILGVSILF